MKTPVCPHEELARFFKSVQNKVSQPLPDKLDRHIKNCQACQKLLKSPALREALIKNFFSENTKESFAVMLNNTKQLHDVTRVEPGQLWGLLYGENQEQALAVIASEPFATESDDAITSRQGVRIMPVYASPCPADFDKKTDLIAEPKQSPTGITLLIEWWNERPVLLENLATLYGNLPGTLQERLARLVADEPALAGQAKSVRFFREVETARGALISADFFKHLQAAESACLENEPVVIDEPFIIDFAALAANEELALAAASHDEIFYSLKKYINQKSKLFKMIIIEETGASIYSLNKKPFRLIIECNKKLFERHSTAKGVLHLSLSSLNDELDQGIHTITLMYEQP
ncbi:MAG TPA: hypothetical protein PLM07_10955 [Candidatus Rifleibacterium sp.]|nr:hypothetical protein [Candidatus Rifleibacterium sp.]HPT46411.1 hypothetical protein [Candidatus Rifleibacterium sp.]